MSALAPNPQTASGTPGLPSYALPQNMAFPTAYSAGAPIDSTYLANEATNRHDIATRYADFLSQLGYVDPTTGQFIPGSVQQQQGIDEANLQQQIDQADLAEQQASQQQGILFSGVRGQLRSQAERPFVQQIGQIEHDTPITLAGLYSQAADLINQYNTQNMTDLANAATRYTASHPAAVSTDTPVVTPPPPAVTPPPPAVTPPAKPATPAESKWGDVNAYYGLPGTGISAGNAYTSGHAPGVALMARGGEVTQPTNAIVGENATPGDPMSHEVVVPRMHLNPDENAVLTHLANTARARAAGDISGPGGAIRGIAPDPSVGLLPAPMHPAAALQAMGDHGAAVDMWMGNHPAALAGHATGIPNWVRAAVTARLAAMSPRAQAGV